MVKSIIISVLILLVLAADSLAATEVITFDDLPTVPAVGKGTLPSLYEGFTWSEFALASPTVQSGYNGLLFGLVSAPNLAFDNDTIGAISRATPFTVNSVYMTSAFLPDGYATMRIVGLRGGAVAYDESFPILESKPSLLSLNYQNVDTIKFFSISNAQPPTFVIDNLSVTVPEPALPALIALAALGLVLIRSRLEHSPSGSGDLDSEGAMSGPGSRPIWLVSSRRKSHCAAPAH